MTSGPGVMERFAYYFLFAWKKNSFSIFPFPVLSPVSLMGTDNAIEVLFLSRFAVIISQKFHTAGLQRYSSLRTISCDKTGTTGIYAGWCRVQE